MPQYNKRAKWIEGITQSNRILRDLAEITTTAIRNEEGISESENWSLIYPRPFKETIIDRGQLIQNPDRLEGDLNKDYLPIDDIEEFHEMLGVTPIALQYETIIPSTLVVTSEGGGTTYVQDTDYTYDAATNTIARIDTGAIVDGTMVRAAYGVKLFSLLQAAPVTIYKKLVESNPYRPISSDDYTLDRSNGTVVFSGEVPTNTEAFLLSFTEETSVTGSTYHDQVEMEIDYLDPNLKTYKIPDGYGRIREVSEEVEVASTAGGADASGRNPYTLDGTLHTVTFRDVPVYDDTVKMMITAYEYTDSSLSSTRSINVEIIPDTADTTGTVFQLAASLNQLNVNQAHRVDATITSKDAKLERRLSELDAGVEIVSPDKYRIDYETTIITFLDEQELTTEFQVSLIANGQYDLEEGLSKIKDRIVLKTVTQPEVPVDQIIGTDYGARDTSSSLEMFVEFRKPERLIHPETGMTIYHDHEGATLTTQLNNHYIESRMFDQWDDMIQEPKRAVGNDAGDIIERGAYVSDWSKYSWFKDWKEYLVDEIDTTPGMSDISKGVILQEVKTSGMTEEFPIQFWISTNNNRLAMILMGDPTLDQDNFLTSLGYFGRIHPFYDSECIVKKDEAGTIVLDSDGNPVIEEKRTYFENDVKGNFALTTGSSTIPANVSQPPKGQPVIVDGGVAMTLKDEPILDAEGNPVLDSEGNPTYETVEVPDEGGELYDGTTYNYIVTYLTPDGESKPSTKFPVVANFGLVDGETLNKQIKGVKTKIVLRLPDEATGYRIYRAWSEAEHPKYEYTHLHNTRTYYNSSDNPSGYSGYWAANEVRVYTKRATSYDTNFFRERVVWNYDLDPDVAKDMNNWKLVTGVEQLNTVNREFSFEDTGIYLGMERVDNLDNAYPVDSNDDAFATVRGAVSVARGFESVVRDIHTGTILNVKFSSRYGRETATGVNDIAMFQTRSGLKYQRHSAAFITTEEFMKKERSGQSRWTGKFHLSPIYLEHGYDKQRGWLDGVMAVDDAGIEHLDELIVDKDTPNEEVYKFFRINAPYSFFNNSPNYAYGIAIIKSSLKWE